MSKSSDMSSSLNFGPEWLRALSGGNAGDSETKPTKSLKRFKLAEFRYGREEMLALFTGNLKLPQELVDFGDVILGETSSDPLSFIPLSEEEERCQVAGVNSSVVLRMSGRGAPTRGRGAIRGARGGGRGRGDGQPGYYRSLSNEDGYANRESYARRPWTEGSRGGSTDRGGGRGDMSPGRGGYEPRARLPSDKTGPAERDQFWEDEEGGGWRVSGQRAWRKGSADASKNWRSDRSKGEESPDQIPRSRSWNRPANEREENIWRHGSTSSASGLPEWCEDNSDEDLGTFDSSGQFKSFKHNEQKQGQNHEKAVFEMGEEDNWDSGPLQKHVIEEDHAEDNGKNNEKTNKDILKVTQSQNKKDEKINLKSPSPQSMESKSPKPVSISVSDLEKELTRETNLDTKAVKIADQNNVALSKSNDVMAEIIKIVSKNQTQQPTGEINNTDDANLNMDHIRNLLDKLDDEHDDPFEAKQFSPQTQDFDQSVDPSILFAKKAEPGGQIKEMQDWIYRDPQGEIQGPFSNEEMLEWFKAGYFTMELLVRRVCDEIFLPLGDVIKVWNRVPFLPGTAPASITSQRLAVQRTHRQQTQYQRHVAQQQQQQQQQQQKMQQQQQQQHDLRLLQQMQHKQQQLDLQQRPRNLNVGQDVSIWGESPTQSPNLASTPWSPSMSQPEPGEVRRSEDVKQKSDKDAALERIKRDVEDDDRRRQKILEDQRPKKSEENKLKESEKRKQTDKDSQEMKEDTIETKPEDGDKSTSDEDSKKEVTSSKKGNEKKKKQEADKKKAERERQQQREEDQRKALEALEKQQQQKQAMQKMKEEEAKQRLLQQQQQMMQQQQLQQQQQQHLLKQQQQQQQLMLLQQQQQHQEESRRHAANDVPSWNVPVSSSAPSLAEIQRIEEQKQMSIREKLQQIQAHEQRLQQQQRVAAGWGEKGGNPVASLRQIQEEEARQLLARQRNKHQQQQQQQHMQQAKMNQNTMPSSVWNTKGQQPPPNYGAYDTSSTPSFWDDVMTSAPSLESANHFQRSNSKTRPASDSSFPTLAAPPKQNKKPKEEELVRRLFQQSNPCDDFVQWVNKNLPAIGELVDVTTFVQFLQEVNSPYEVYEYIRSYFGDSSDAQKFAREFLGWRKTNGRPQNAQFQTAVSEPGMMPMNSDMISPEGDDPNGRRKKQKKKMQKVNPSLLGFSCNPDPGLTNRGEIQSAMDAWNLK